MCGHHRIALNVEADLWQFLYLAIDYCSYTQTVQSPTQHAAGEYQILKSRFLRVASLNGTNCRQPAEPIIVDDKDTAVVCPQFRRSVHERKLPKLLTKRLHYSVIIVEVEISVPGVAFD